MKILEIEKLNKPSFTTFVMFFLFFCIGLIIAFSFAIINFNPFPSVFTFLSITMILFYLYQVDAVMTIYGKYKKTNIRMNGVFISTFIYIIFVITLFIPFIYINIPAFQLTANPYNIDSYEKNVSAIVNLAIKNAPTKEVFDILINYGKYTIIVPYTLITTFLLSFLSWVYLRMLKSYHFNLLSEQNVRKEKEIKIKKENEEKKIYKWN